MESKIKGDNYELQIYYYLMSIYKDHEVFLWYHVPIKYLIELKFIDNNNDDIKSIKQAKDIGCDILMKNISTNKFIFVQCKNYNNKNICINDLGGFPLLIATRNDVDGILISNSDISKNIKKAIVINNKITHVIVKYEEMIESIKENTKTFSNNINNNIIPFKYQIDAYKCLFDKKRAICHMPCGTGKTIVAMMLAKNYDNIIIFSPLLLFATQLLDEFKSQFDYNNVLIDSEGTRDIKKIKLSNKNIISATYKSADVVNKIINNLNKCLVIVDEFHNLSENNVTNKNDELNKILTNDKFNFLFLSATPKLYNFSSEVNKAIFGKIEFSYSFADAIKNKHINDYRIIIPDKKNTYDNYQFIYHNILYYGYNKCIIYCENKNKANEMIIGIKKNNIYDVPIYMDVMTYNTSLKKRNEILKNFRENTMLSIIVSVHILDECVNIQECDSIYISYKNKFQVKTIQRICRCLRIHSSKRQKSGIFLYCKKINEIQNYFNEIIDNKIDLNMEVTDDVSEIMNNYKTDENLILFENKNIQQNESNVVCEKNIIFNKNENLMDFLKKNSNVDPNFINDIFSHYDENKNSFTINLVKLVFFLDKDKDKLKIILLRNYIQNKDYIINIDEEYLKKYGGKPKETIMLTYDTAKKISMGSKGLKADNIKNFYIELENLLIKILK